MLVNPGGEFTQRAQQAIFMAQELARKNNQQQIDALHLLYSLVSQEETVVATILTKLKIDIPELKNKIIKAIF